MERWTVEQRVEIERVGIQKTSEQLDGGLIAWSRERKRGDLAEGVKNTDIMVTEGENMTEIMKGLLGHKRRQKRSTEETEITGKCSYIHEWRDYKEMANRCVFVLSGKRIQIGWRQGSGNTQPHSEGEILENWEVEWRVWERSNNRCSGDGKDMLQVKKLHSGKEGQAAGMGRGKQPQRDWREAKSGVTLQNLPTGREALKTSHSLTQRTHTQAHAQKNTVSELHSQTLESLGCCTAPTSSFSLSGFLFLFLWPWGFNQQCLTALFVCYYSFFHTKLFIDIARIT